jgi:hypothetical protein
MKSAVTAESAQVHRSQTHRVIDRSTHQRSGNGANANRTEFSASASDVTEGPLRALTRVGADDEGRGGWHPSPILSCTSPWPSE